MKIECTVDELKELMQEKTPSAGTLDVIVDGKVVNSIIHRDNHD